MHLIVVYYLALKGGVLLRSAYTSLTLINTVRKS